MSEKAVVSQCRASEQACGGCRRRVLHDAAIDLLGEAVTCRGSGYIEAQRQDMGSCGDIGNVHAERSILETGAKDADILSVHELLDGCQLPDLLVTAHQKPARILGETADRDEGGRDGGWRRDRHRTGDRGHLGRSCIVDGLDIIAGLVEVDAGGGTPIGQRDRLIAGLDRAAAGEDFLVDGLPGEIGRVDRLQPMLEAYRFGSRERRLEIAV